MGFDVSHNISPLVSGLSAFLIGRDEQRRRNRGQEIQNRNLAIENVSQGIDTGMRLGTSVAMQRMAQEQATARQRMEDQARLQAIQQAQQAITDREEAERLWQAQQNDAWRQAAPPSAQREYDRLKRAIFELPKDQALAFTDGSLNEAGQAAEAKLNEQLNNLQQAYPTPPPPRIEEQKGVLWDTFEHGGVPFVMYQSGPGKMQMRPLGKGGDDDDDFKKIFDDEYKNLRSEMMPKEGEGTVDTRLIAAQAYENAKARVAAMQGNVQLPPPPTPPPPQPQAQGSPSDFSALPFGMGIPIQAGRALLGGGQAQAQPEIPLQPEETADLQAVTTDLLKAVSENGQNVRKWPDEALQEAAPAAARYVEYTKQMHPDIGQWLSSFTSPARRAEFGSLKAAQEARRAEVDSLKLAQDIIDESQRGLREEP